MVFDVGLVLTVYHNSLELFCRVSRACKCIYDIGSRRLGMIRSKHDQGAAFSGVLEPTQLSDKMSFIKS